MEFRPATAGDLAAITDLQVRYDLAWFDAREHSEAEVEEFLGYADPLAENSLLAFVDERLVAAAMRFGSDTMLTADPTADVAAVYAGFRPSGSHRSACPRCGRSGRARGSQVDA